MRKMILSFGLVLAVLATSAFGTSQKFYCKLTKRIYDRCCCDMK
jgi:hypothetical protein